MKKLSTLLLIILLCSVWLISLNNGTVKAQYNTIYIKEDGSVEGTDKIQRDRNVYTFTDDIQNSIIITKDNAILDGAGHTLEYLRKNHGLTVNGKTVTIKGLIVTQTETNSTYGVGIYVNATTNCIIDNCTITGNNIGIAVSQSLKTRISNNNITNNDFSGISISYPETNIIGNLVTENGRGIYIVDYVENIIWKNQIKNNVIGIDCLALSNMDTINKNQIYENNFINNTHHFSSSSMMAFPLENTFEKDSVGNYWSNYNGTDNDGDGIGDTPYIIIDENQDNYPLINPIDLEMIPEFTSWLILPLFLIATLSIAFYRKKIWKQQL